MVNRNFYYTLFILGIVFIAFTDGCNKSNPSSGGGGSSGSISSISGTIESWSFGSEVTLKLCSYLDGTWVSFGTSQVTSSGKFNISKLDKPIVLLVPIDNIFSDLTVSDHNVNIAWMKIYLRAFQPSESNPFLRIWKTKQVNPENGETVGDFFVEYIYVDKAVNITGETNDSPSETLKFNLSLKTGWNKIVEKVIAKDESSETFEFSSSEPSGGKWQYTNDTFAQEK